MITSGGWLTDTAIAAAVESGDVLIDPFSADLLNPTSYNYRLGPEIYRLLSPEIDLMGEEEYEHLKINEDGLVLYPNECYLGHTVESFGSTRYAGLITGRSSVGRKFITNHVTSGLIDIGFYGQITLEILVQRPTKVYPGVPFGQIFWFSLSEEPTSWYEGRYNEQDGPTASRMAHDLESPRQCRDAVADSP